MSQLAVGSGSDSSDFYESSSYEYNSEGSDTPYKYISEEEEEEQVGNVTDKSLAPTTFFMKRMQSYNIVDDEHVSNFVANAIENIMNNCGVAHSTAAHILICYDWDEHLITQKWWHGDTDEKIQRSRDEVCLKAGIPRNGPIVYDEAPEKNGSICSSCKACPRDLLKNKINAAAKNNDNNNNSSNRNNGGAGPTAGKWRRKKKSKKHVVC